MGRQRERAENSAGGNHAQAEDRIDAKVLALETARTRIEVATPLKVAIEPCNLPPGRLVLACHELVWGVGERLVISGLTFSLRGPERVALIGRNGAGKTTVLKLAAGIIAPTSGTIERLVPLAMLDQTVSLLDPDAKLIDNMRRLNPELAENGARAALARFAFRNIAGDRPVRELSGGERLRAGLACVLSARTVPQLLILDEPTNHLDLESIEVIEQALRAFDGALLLASHDAAFRDAVGVTRQIQLG
jgi:ATPase subunit of ABC transporter with duplicated ATPase domains